MFTVTFFVLHPRKLCYMCRGQTDIPPSYAHHKMVPFFQAHSLLLSIPQETKSVKIYVSCFFLIPLLYDIGGKSCFSQCLLHFCRIIQFFKRSTVNPVSPILSRFDHSIVSQKEQLCLQCPGIFFQIKKTKLDAVRCFCFFFVFIRFDFLCIDGLQNTVGRSPVRLPQNFHQRFGCLLRC